MPRILKALLFWIIIVFIASTLAENVFGEKKGSEITYSEFLQGAENNQVNDVTISGGKIYGTTADGQKFYTNVPFGYDKDIVATLHAKNINIKAVAQETGGIGATILGWLPEIIFIAIWVYFIRRMMKGPGGGGGGGGAFGFGKSKARRIDPKDIGVTFGDVAGIEEAKEELEEIVDFLRQPQKYQRLGGKVPKGALLVGPPGTGKTLLGKAIAGEAQVPFFSISGSDFVEMFVGVGASRVREMFAEARRNAPAIIFIDEIDAIGRQRGNSMSGGHEEREQTLNQMLVEMDGFDSTTGVIVLGATNRADVLDKALLRPGRFDRQITVNNPDVKGREKIVAVHLAKVSSAPDIDVSVIARGTPGFSGADLANLVNEAALLAARKNKNLVTMREFDEARDKVMMGLERKSLVMKPEEIRKTAYHEAGHALVTLLLDDADPIHKATIVPRGQALGMVQQLPEGDRVSKTRAQYKADLAVYMGGRAAEEVEFGYDKVTSGAAGDIQGATQIAQAMVRQAGLSDVVGTIYHEANALESDEMTRIINDEVKKLVDEGLELARKLLKENKDEFVAVAEALLKYETLSGDELKLVMEGKDLDKDRDNILSLGGSHIGSGSSLVPKSGDDE